MLKELIPKNTKEEIKNKLRKEDLTQWKKFCSNPCYSEDVFYLKILEQNNICPG